MSPDISTVMRRWEWAMPPAPVELELRSQVPEGWAELPDAERPAPLLFVHGICSGAWAFDRHWLPAAVARGIPAHAVSLRGHGTSGGREHLRTTTLGAYTHDVLQAITRLPEPPVLVGHSMGALVVRAVAERYPARGLVLLAPAPAHGAMRSGLHQFRIAPANLARSVVTAHAPERPDLMFSGLPVAEAEATIAAMGPESPLVMMDLLRPRTFARPDCPVAVIGAGDDRMIVSGDVTRTAAELGVSPVWVADVGHEMMLDAGEDRALGAVLDWVAMAVPPGTPRLPGQR